MKAIKIQPNDALQTDGSLRPYRPAAAKLIKLRIPKQPQAYPVKPHIPEGIRLLQDPTLLASARKLRDIHVPAEAGKAAESLACDWLTSEGWTILARRMHFFGVEADIIAIKDGLIAVCEVKYRKQMSCAQESVSASQQSRLRSIGEVILSRFGDIRTFLRYDVFTFADDKRPRHIPNAF